MLYYSLLVLCFTGLFRSVLSRLFIAPILAIYLPYLSPHVLKKVNGETNMQIMHALSVWLGKQRQT